jgi:hypothetical protein
MTCGWKTMRIDVDNGEVSMKKMVATARWNLLEFDRQMDLMILDDLDEAHAFFSELGPGGLSRAWDLYDGIYHRLVK